MSVKTTFAALALIAVAGAASAASVNPGTAQLSRQLGVEPGTLSLSKLTALKAATGSDNQDLAKFIRSGGEARADRGANAGKAQIEAQLNVEPGKFTTAELIALKTARRENDSEAVKFILSGENRRAPAEASVVTPGKAQLAARIGVNPADYTLSQLVALQPSSSSN